MNSNVLAAGLNRMFHDQVLDIPKQAITTYARYACEQDLRSQLELWESKGYLLILCDFTSCDDDAVCVRMLRPIEGFHADDKVAKEKLAARFCSLLSDGVDVVTKGSIYAFAESKNDVEIMKILNIWVASGHISYLADFKSCGMSDKCVRLLKIIQRHAP